MGKSDGSLRRSQYSVEGSRGTQINLPIKRGTQDVGWAVFLLSTRWAAPRSALSLALQLANIGPLFVSFFSLPLIFLFSGSGSKSRISSLFSFSIQNFFSSTFCGENSKHGISYFTQRSKTNRFICTQSERLNS